MDLANESLYLDMQELSEVTSAVEGQWRIVVAHAQGVEGIRHDYQLERMLYL